MILLCLLRKNHFLLLFRCFLMLNIEAFMCFLFYCLSWYSQRVTNITPKCYVLNNNQKYVFFRIFRIFSSLNFSVALFLTQSVDIIAWFKFIYSRFFCITWILGGYFEFSKMFPINPYFCLLYGMVGVVRIFLCEACETKTIFVIRMIYSCIYFLV